MMCSFQGCLKRKTMGTKKRNYGDFLIGAHGSLGTVTNEKASCGFINNKVV